MKRIAKLFLAALLAWIGGLGIILVLLYFANRGADFTVTDIMGFGVAYVVASGALMLVIYLPALLWLRRKSEQLIWYPLFSGVLLNLPLFALLAFLIERKMSASEALAFMLVFFFAGSVFGLGFFWANIKTRAA